MPKLSIFFPISLLILLLCSSLSAQSARDSLHQELTELQKQSSIPGYAVSIIRNGEVKFIEGYGYADIQSDKKYTGASIQNIGSVSKTFIGVSLMKAVELGLLNLDDPINKYLPYKIENPRFPNQPISIRHLASHTSSLNDPEDYERAYIFQDKIETQNQKLPKGYGKMIKLYNQNKRVSLDDFVKSIYVPSGQYYKSKNYTKQAPGSKFVYSNIGAGIAAHIIALASGMTFQAFTDKYIFQPLQMNNSGWDLTPAVLQQKVTPYLNPTLPIPHYDLITFADGGLITSVEDMSKYIIEMMSCYEGKGTILSQELCQEMMKPYLKDSKEAYGIFWSRSKSGLSIGHNGADPGAITNVYFQPSTGVAKIMFSNMLPYTKEQNQVFQKTWQGMRNYELRIEK